MSDRSQPARARAGASGPLRLEELTQLWERGLSLLLREMIAKAWGAPAQSPSALYAAMQRPERARAMLRDMPARERAILQQLAHAGGRMRGESARKALLLRGAGDCARALRQLLELGLILPAPSTQLTVLEHEPLLVHQGFLSMELALTPALYALLTRSHEPGASHAEGHEVPERGEVGAWEGSARLVRRASVEALELDLLHLCAALTRAPLRLNRSGMPNRRSLSRLARGLCLPGLDAGIAHEDLDLSDPEQADYLAFLMALARQLELLSLQDQALLAQPARVEALMCAPEPERNRALLSAIRDVKVWSEVLSHGIAHGLSDEGLVSRQLSITEPNGAPLIGARGYVLSLLRRAHLRGWTPLEALVELGTRFDRDYLPRVLERASVEVSPQAYLRIWLTHALCWMGVVELGEGQDEARVDLMRFTARGMRVLGVEDAPEPAHTTQPCLIVQPNLEVTVLLDAADTADLAKLYQLARRVTLADRAATFRLSAESVQRGYALGLDAAKAAAFLSERGLTPLPESIRVQLEEWERLWRRVMLRADGVLLRHADPDQLDLALEQLRVVWRDRAPHVERLAPDAAFIDHPDPPGLSKLLEQRQGLRLDYMGELPATMRAPDALTLTVQPQALDLVSAHALRQLASLEGQGAGTQRWRLDLDAIHARCGDDALEHLLGWLEPRLVGGVAPAQTLTLRSMMERPPRAILSEPMVLITMEDAQTARLLSEVPQVRALGAQLIADAVLALPAHREAALRALLASLSMTLRRA